MDKHVLATILRRWIAGKSIVGTNELEGFDRKTVCAYIRRFEAHGHHPDQENVDPDRLDSASDALLPNNRRLNAREPGLRRPATHICREERLTRSGNDHKGEGNNEVTREHENRWIMNTKCHDQLEVGLQSTLVGNMIALDKGASSSAASTIRSGSRHFARWNVLRRIGIGG
jgi:hypothetical protein